LYTVFRNSSISDEHVFCVALHFTIGRIVGYIKIQKNFLKNVDISLNSVIINGYREYLIKK
ncbi:hypothetical protein, partial [Streptococcus salivarius]|uniref:hypothetical protein n=1 Tax=Streptococcus salivarius TaxID=1304 RepID=UPI0011074F7A